MNELRIEVEGSRMQLSIPDLLTELWAGSIRYTGKPRKYIPADVTFPAFELSSYKQKFIMTKVVRIEHHIESKLQENNTS